MVVAPHGKEQKQCFRHYIRVLHSANYIYTCFELHNNLFCNWQIIIHLRKSAASEFQHKLKEKGEAGPAITFPKLFTLDSMFGFGEAFLFSFPSFLCAI